MKGRNFVDARNARSQDYNRIINEIGDKGVCPFCPENFSWHTEPIIKRNARWLLTTNFRPYEHAKYHLLLINRRHIEEIKQMKTQDWLALAQIINWTVKSYEIKSGAMAMRFGSTLYTGATVAHLHSHLIVPKYERGKVEPVNFPIG